MSLINYHNSHNLRATVDRLRWLTKNEDFPVIHIKCWYLCIGIHTFTSIMISRFRSIAEFKIWNALTLIWDCVISVYRRGGDRWEQVHAVYMWVNLISDKAKKWLVLCSSANVNEFYCSEKFARSLAFCISHFKWQTDVCQASLDRRWRDWWFLHREKSVGG